MSLVGQVGPVWQIDSFVLCIVAIYYPVGNDTRKDGEWARGHTGMSFLCSLLWQKH